MKKTSLMAQILVISMVAMLSLSGCGGSAGSSVSPEESQEVKPRVLKLGHKSSETHSWQLGSIMFADLVKERTNGEIIIDIYPNSQLGDQKEMTEAAQLGVIDIVLNAPATLSGFIPGIDALDLPFLFRDYEHAFKALDSVCMDYYAPLCEEVDLKMLSFWDTGFKNLSNNRREIKTVDDLKNLKIRYAGGGSLSATIEALGASAISIPWSETYIALSQGTADAQFNPPSTMVESKIHEVQKYYSSNLTVQYGAEPVIMSLKTWDSLTKEQQDIILAACAEAGAYQRELNMKMDQDALQLMIDEGVIVSDVSPEVLVQIQEMTATVLNKHGDPEMVSKIQKIQ
jgi:tripartite ATP-independent transporter DctP family solute receptor